MILFLLALRHALGARDFALRYARRDCHLGSISFAADDVAAAHADMPALGLLRHTRILYEFERRANSEDKTRTGAYYFCAISR